MILSSFQNGLADKILCFSLQLIECIIQMSSSPTLLYLNPCHLLGHILSLMMIWPYHWAEYASICPCRFSQAIHSAENTIHRRSIANHRQVE